jgi:hypothetical protein
MVAHPVLLYVLIHAAVALGLRLALVIALSVPH